MRPQWVVGVAGRVVGVRRKLKKKGRGRVAAVVQVKAVAALPQKETLTRPPPSPFPLPPFLSFFHIFISLIHLFHPPTPSLQPPLNPPHSVRSPDTAHVRSFVWRAPPSTFYFFYYGVEKKIHTHSGSPFDDYTARVHGCI